MVKLEDVGYKVTRNTKQRRRALGKAVKKAGYQQVYNILSSRISRAVQKYKVDRYRADRNWLKRKMRKAGKNVE